jgi:hypothetical protein
MSVKCHYSGGARRGEGKDKGRILKEGRGAVGAKETWGAYEWARGEVDRNRNT